MLVLLTWTTLLPPVSNCYGKPHQSAVHTKYIWKSDSVSAGPLMLIYLHELKPAIPLL